LFNYIAESHTVTFPFYMVHLASGEKVQRSCKGNAAIDTAMPVDGKRH